MLRDGHQWRRIRVYSCPGQWELLQHRVGGDDPRFALQYYDDDPAQPRLLASDDDLQHLCTTRGTDADEITVVVVYVIQRPDTELLLELGTKAIPKRCTCARLVSASQAHVDDVTWSCRRLSQHRLAGA